MKLGMRITVFCRSASARYCAPFSLILFRSRYNVVSVCVEKCNLGHEMAEAGQARHRVLSSFIKRVNVIIVGIRNTMASRCRPLAVWNSVG